MRKLNAKGLRARALRSKDIATTDLQWIADNAEAIANRYNAELDDATRARAYDGDGRGGAELTGPEAHVDARMPKDTLGNIIRDPHGRPVITDPDQTLRHIANAMLGSVDLTATSATAARTEAGKLTTANDTGNRQAQATAARGTSGRGTCDNCGHWCEGTRNDRLVTPVTSDTNRAGAIAQCPACLRYWYRHGKLRPANRWDIDELAG
jgi:post-segregation antitoxin (ccd killing protein)